MSDSVWLVGETGRSSPRLRPNLQWTLQNATSQAWWILSDPITNRHFRCEHLEARFLQLLDGKRSIREAVSELTKQFPASELAHPRVISILRFAEANQLLMPQRKRVGSVKDASVPNKNSRLTTTLHGLRRTLMSIAYQRVPLGNPNRIAATLAAHTDWLFSESAVQLWTGFLLTSLLALLVSIFRVDHTTWDSALSLSSIGDWRMWLSCLVIFIITRILHESAHAVVCVRQGARCNQVGLMRILFIAFPYVDVSDAWRIADRNARMAVFAAGIYVDLIVASIAVWIWQGSQPGFVDNLALITMAMGVTGSLLFNANPLMKYDGYHVLSEWLEVADLQRSSKAIYQSWLKCLVAPKHSDQSSLRQRSGPVQFLLAFYAPASHAYRMILAFGILMAMLLSFHAWHLTEIGWSVIGMSVVLGVAITADRQFRSQVSPRASSDRTKPRSFKILRSAMRFVLWLGAAVCLCALAMVPLPERVHAEGIIASQDRQPIFVNAPTTTLQRITQDGSTDIQLSRDSIDGELMRLRQNIEETDAKYTALQHAVYFEPKLFGQLPQMETIRQLRQRRYDFLESQSANFHLSVSADSQFLACSLPRPQIAMDITGNGIIASEKLTPYTTLLNAQLLGSRLERGTLIGYCCAQHRRPSLDIRLNQADRLSVHIGQVAKVRLQQYPHRVFKASVKSISQLISDRQSDQTQKRQQSTNPTTEQAHYQVDLLFDESLDDLPFVENGNAEVVFATRGKSLYAHFIDYTNRLTR